MKKNILLQALLFLNALVFAQGNNFELGVMGGLGIANMRNSPFSTGNIYQVNKKITSATGGISMGQKINKYVSLRGYLLYETKGEDTNFSSTDPNVVFVNGHTAFKYNYTTFHFSARGTYGDEFKVYLEAGPYVGYLINAYAIQYPSSQTVGGITYPPKKTNLTENRNSVDYGISGGLGFIYEFNNKININLCARRSLGLKNIIKNSESNYKTNLFQGMAGINFKL